MLSGKVFISFTIAMMMFCELECIKKKLLEMKTIPSFGRNVDYQALSLKGLNKLTILYDLTTLLLGKYPTE